MEAELAAQAALPAPPRSRGVQATLDAAAQGRTRLARALELLATRLSQRPTDVTACLSRLYRSLAKDFHGGGDQARTGDPHAAPQRSGAGTSPAQHRSQQALPQRAGSTDAPLQRLRPRGLRSQVVVREADFSAPAERLALCAVLEAYDVPYEYWDVDGRLQLTSSPYALLPAERSELAAVAAL